METTTLNSQGTLAHSSESISLPAKQSDHGLIEVSQKTYDKWNELQSKGEFNVERALNTLKPLSQQKEFGKNLNELIKNAHLLPDIESEIKYHSESTCAMKLIIILNQLNKLSLGKNSFASESGVKDIALRIVQDETLKRWKLVEFDLLVQGMLKGKYGKFYDRLDSEVLYDCINQYDKERMEAIEHNRQKKEGERYIGTPDKEGLIRLAGEFERMKELHKAKKEELRKIDHEKIYQRNMANKERFKKLLEEINNSETKI